MGKSKDSKAENLPHSPDNENPPDNDPPSRNEPSPKNNFPPTTSIHLHPVYYEEDHFPRGYPYTGFGPVPSYVTCPFCGNSVWTMAVKVPTILTHMCALLTCLCLGPFCIYCYIFCVFARTEHYCPVCNRCIGVYIP